MFQNISTVIQMGHLDVASRNYFCLQESLITQIQYLSGINVLLVVNWFSCQLEKKNSKKTEKSVFSCDRRYFKTWTSSNVSICICYSALSKSNLLSHWLSLRKHEILLGLSKTIKKHSKVECSECLQCIVITDNNLNPNVGWQQSNWNGFNLSQIVQVGQNTQ